MAALKSWKDMNKRKFVKMIALDFVVALVGIGFFLLYFYVLPQEGGESERVLTATENVSIEQFVLPGNSTDTTADKTTHRTSQKRSEKSAPSKNTGKGPGKSQTTIEYIGSDVEEAKKLSETQKNRTELNSYQNDSVKLTIEQVQMGEDESQVTYYVADVYVTSINLLRTAFAGDTYGKNFREETLEIANDNQAILAISGDSYGNSENGIVVRNGVLYREETNDAEICVLFCDGTMKTYTAKEFNDESILEQEVWQIWNFGPALVEDGRLINEFQTTSYLNRTHPRCAIGYVEPGHYKFVVVDGRDEGYSKGVTLSELAQIMKEEGCENAYNLDGGKSSAMVFQGEYVNQPADGGRTISDIIYIAGEE